MIMAKNAPTGDNRRIGAVKSRTQTFNPKTEQWVKRDSNTGRLWMLNKMAHLLKA